MNINQIMQRLDSCTCGLDHRLPLPIYVRAPQLHARLPALLSECGLDKQLQIVADRTTLSVAAPVVASLQAAGYQLSHTTFADMRNATIESAQRVLSDIKQSGATGILAIGSGSINDVSRYAAHLCGLDYAICATAPSMDGFTSTVAPLVDSGFKRTYPAVAPRGVFADSELLAAAPFRLRAAGVGDLLGKFTALADWQAMHVLTGEYWCPQIAGLVRQATDLACARAGAILSGDPSAVGDLMDALVLSGFGMLLVGNSRPASGAEHHVSHFWEMRYLSAGLPQEFHGIKVGSATLELAPIYAALADLDQPPPLVATPDAQTIHAVFGPLAAEVLKENTPDPLAAIVPELVRSHWPALRQILADIPAVEDLRQWFMAAGGDSGARELGIPELWVAEALRYAPLVRSRLSIIRLFGAGPF